MPSFSLPGLPLPSLPLPTLPTPPKNGCRIFRLPSLPLPSLAFTVYDVFHSLVPKTVERQFLDVVNVVCRKHFRWFLAAILSKIITSNFFFENYIATDAFFWPIFGTVNGRVCQNCCKNFWRIFLGLIP